MLGDQIPLLVVVSGLPAAGKSSLSRRLSVDLSLPLVSRDRLRPSLNPVADAVSDDSGWLIGRSLDQIINYFVHRLLDVGIGAVVDSNFNLPEQRQAIRDLVNERRPKSVEICLWADPDVLRNRFIARNDPPLTDDLAPYFDQVVNRAREPALAPPASVLEFDTTEFVPSKRRIRL
jgi:predicted kinase